MTWVSVTESGLTIVILLWLVALATTWILRGFGVSSVRLPNVDKIMPLVLMLYAALAVVARMSWHDQADRAFIEGFAVFAFVIIAMWIYGRLFVLPRLRNAPPRPPPSNLIKAGFFRDWAPQVLRNSAISLIVLVVAGTMSAEWILHGRPLLGGIAAGVAFIALPQVLATLLAMWLKSAFRPNP